MKPCRVLVGANKIFRKGVMQGLGVARATISAYIARCYTVNVEDSSQLYGADGARTSPFS